MVKRLKLMAPVVFRLILLCCVCLGIAGLASPVWGFGLLILGLFLEIFMHLNYIALLAQWLEEPGLPDTPSVRSGVWSEIFYRIAKSRKQLEKNTRRLTEREARYRKTLAALPEGIVLVKSDWSVTWCNDVAEKIFGIEGEDDAGRHLLAFVSDEGLQNYIKSGNFASPYILRTKSPNTANEIRLVDVDRKTRILIARDVTEQERLDAMRRDFVANVSHELRTPLTVLSGFLDMALNGIDEKAPTKLELQASHLHLMREQAGRMQRLINDLLTLSRLENEEQTKPSEIINLSSMLNTIAEEIRVMAVKTHTVQTDIAANMSVHGWPDELRSAVVNLMTNAVRYSPSGGIIKLAGHVKENGAIAISVTDHGIGIAEKTFRGSPSASIASTNPVHATRAARAWDWPSSSMYLFTLTQRCTSKVVWEKARPSRWKFRLRSTPHRKTPPLKASYAAAGVCRAFDAPASPAASRVRPHSSLRCNDVQTMP